VLRFVYETGLSAVFVCVDWLLHAVNYRIIYMLAGHVVQGSRMRISLIAWNFEVYIWISDCGSHGKNIALKLEKKN
jgi:hypothetical protein